MIKHSLVLFTLLMIALCSCYSPRYVYSPAAHNVPLLTEKGDSKLAAYYSSNLSGNTSINLADQQKSSGSGYDLQGAVAVTEHFAIQASYVKRKELNYALNNLARADTSVINYRRNLTELGVGYYTGLDERGFIFFQVFAGAGVGKSSLSDLYNSGVNRHFNMKVQKLYLQPAFTFRYQNVFTSTFSNRISFIYFSDIATDYSDEELRTYKLSNLNSSSHVFIEPCVITSFGINSLPGIRVEMQFGMSFISNRQYVDHRGFNFSIGAVADLPKLIRSKR